MTQKSDLVRTLPSACSKRQISAKLAKYTECFYEFNFDCGVSTKVDPLLKTIHHTRAELIFPFLDQSFKGRWNEISCLDMACHQGWFAIQVALRGAREVCGIDIRQEHIEMSSLIRNLAGLDNILFKQGNLFEINRQEDRVYELTLFLGILYHLDNPLEALRIVRSMTGNICVIETQVARPVPELECLWGSSPMPRKGPGLAIVPADDAHSEPGQPFVLVPTLAALYRMLYAVGFNRLYLSVPTPSSYEQYANFDRVVVFAQVL